MADGRDVKTPKSIATKAPPWCGECADTFVVSDRNGVPHECPRCALALRLGMNFMGKSRNFEGKWWAVYGKNPELQKKVMIEFGVRLRFTGEAILQGFHNPPGTPTSTAVVNEVLGEEDT